jgi:hypothetical protein
MKKLKTWMSKQPVYAFILLGAGVFGLLFFLASLLVAYVHSLIPIYGIAVPLILLYIIICIVDTMNETKEKMAKWKEDNPYNYEYYEKKDNEP